MIKVIETNKLMERKEKAEKWLDERIDTDIGESIWQKAYDKYMWILERLNELGE